MNLVRQISKTTCGAACYAMLNNLTIEEAIKVVGNKWISIKDMMGHLGFETKELISGEPPIGCIAIQYHQEPNGSGGHWTVWDKDKILDPACIRKLWPVLGYKVIL